MCKHLPLGLLAVEEVLEDFDNLGQRGEVHLEVVSDLFVVVAELGIEVLAVRAGAHGGAEDGLDDEAVVRLEGLAVGGAERIGNFLGRVGGVLGEGEAGEFETAINKTNLSVFLSWYRETAVTHAVEVVICTYRTSHRRPSVAVCFFVLSSLRQRSWRFSDSAGEVSWRSRTFYQMGGVY